MQPINQRPFLSVMNNNVKETYTVFTISYIFVYNFENC